MNSTQIRIWKTIEDLNRAAARHFSSTVLAAFQARGVVWVCLSGGSTPQGLFTILSQEPYCDALPWEDMHFVWGDERCVPPDDPQSNYGQAQRGLLSHVPVRAENLHRIPGELSPEAAALETQRMLAGFGSPQRPWPRLDWCLMGLGADGHTASLFPGQMPPEEERLSALAVRADYQGRPAERVTLTPAVFNSARQVVFLAAGEQKAPILKAILSGGRDPLHLPAQRIQPLDGAIIWMLDSAAASELPAELMDS